MKQEIKERLLFNSEEIKLPASLIKKIKSYTETELQEGTQLLLKKDLIQEYIYIFMLKFSFNFISIMKTENMKQVIITNNYREELGITRKTKTGKKLRIRTQIIKFLYNENIIIQTRAAVDKWTIEQNPHKNLQAQSRAFIINKENIDNKIKDITLKIKKPMKLIKNNKDAMIQLVLDSKNNTAITQLLMSDKINKITTEDVEKYGRLYLNTLYKGKLFDKKMLKRHISIFNYLVKNSLLIPLISEKSGRVFTSFNLIPSWIRELFLIDGEKTKGLDIKASIPSILNTIFGGHTIDYNYFVEKYNIDYSDAKIMVLKFLFSSNRASKQMTKTYTYFQETNKDLLKKITDYKQVFGNKKLANHLFKIEAEMMEETIKELRKQDIYVYYIFDELIGKEKDYETIKEKMIENLIKFKINTIVK